MGGVDPIHGHVASHIKVKWQDVVMWPFALLLSGLGATFTVSMAAFFGGAVGSFVGTLGYGLLVNVGASNSHALLFALALGVAAAIAFIRSAKLPEKTKAGVHPTEDNILLDVWRSIASVPLNLRTYLARRAAGRWQLADPKAYRWIRLTSPAGEEERALEEADLVRRTEEILRLRRLARRRRSGRA